MLDQKEGSTRPSADFVDFRLSEPIAIIGIGEESMDRALAYASTDFLFQAVDYLGVYRLPRNYGISWPTASRPRATFHPRDLTLILFMIPHLAGLRRCQ